MASFNTTQRSFVLFGLVLVALFFFMTNGEVQARDRQPNKPAPRAPYYFPQPFDYQGALDRANNLPAVYYSPRYYYPPYPYPYPAPYPYPYPVPCPYPHPGAGLGMVR